MYSLDRCIGALAIAQTILATLRASSRVLYIINGGKIGVMEGPLIEPPSNETTATTKRNTNNLWDMSVAFRHGVSLALNRDAYDFEYILNNDILPEVRVQSEGSYSMSTYDSNVEAETSELDSNIDRILKGEQVSLVTTEKKPKPSRKEAKKRVNKALAKAKAPTARQEASLTSAMMAADALDTDCYLKLSTIVTLGDEEQHTSATGTPPKRARITAYAPDCFAELRSFFGLTEDAYERSIFATGPFVSFQSNSKGAARVGGTFFFTRDGAYLIKTIKQDEVKTLLSILPRYYHFMKKYGRRSLLTRFCGMYEVTFDNDDRQPQTFVVMNSVFPADASKFFSERFDLKGSTVGREASAEEKETKGRDAVLKDLDLAREVELVQSLEKEKRRKRRRPSYGINIGPKAKAAFMKQIRRDVSFLVACQVIDYSLLIGVARESFGLSKEDLLALERGSEGERRMQILKKRKPGTLLLFVLTAPIRMALAPAVFLSRKTFSIAQRIVAPPHSYYGSGRCAVDAGPLSQLPGKRRGSKAVYYFGLIDFLQPYNTKKAVEYHLKSVLYDSNSFSCIPPEAYAERFLDFLDKHIV